jgi:hypothetical protein
MINEIIAPEWAHQMIADLLKQGYSVKAIRKNVQVYGYENLPNLLSVYDEGELLELPELGDLFAAVDAIASKEIYQ